MNPKLIKGYAMGIVAAASYGMIPLFTLPLYGEGMSVAWVLFFRYMIAIPVIAGIMVWRKRSFRVSKRQLLALLGLGLVMGFSSLTLLGSYKYMEAAISSTMLFVYPLLVAVIMAVVYKEKLSGLTWCCLGVSVVGLGLLMRSHGGVVSPTGTLWVLTSALTYAVYLVGVGRPLLKDVPTLTATFYVLLAGWSVFIFQTACEGTVELPRSWIGWGCAAGIGIFPTAVSLLCTTVAISLIGSTPTAILGVFEPVVGVMVGVGVFGETLTGGQCVGLILLLSAVTLVIGGESVTRRIVEARRLWPSLRRKKH